MVKLGAIPSIIVLAIMAYIAIPSESNILFGLIDNITSGFCPDIAGICNSIPLLKSMTSIIGIVGFVVTLIHIISMLFKGEFFGVKKS